MHSPQKQAEALTLTTNSINRTAPPYCTNSGISPTEAVFHCDKVYVYSWVFSRDRTTCGRWLTSFTHTVYFGCSPAASDRSHHVQSNPFSVIFGPGLISPFPITSSKSEYKVPSHTRSGPSPHPIFSFPGIFVSASFSVSQYFPSLVYQVPSYQISCTIIRPCESSCSLAGGRIVHIMSRRAGHSTFTSSSGAQRPPSFTLTSSCQLLAARTASRDCRNSFTPGFVHPVATASIINTNESVLLMPGTLHRLRVTANSHLPPASER